jgi:hypothetical protein
MVAERDERAIQYRKVLIIAANLPIRVIDRCVSLQRANNEQVEWEIVPPDRKFKVKFSKQADRPFGDDEFDNENNISGPITVPPDPNGADQFFPYLVEVAGLGSVDPGVIIW